MASEVKAEAEEVFRIYMDIRGDAPRDHRYDGAGGPNMREAWAFCFGLPVEGKMGRWMAVGEGAQVAGTRAGRVHPVHARGDGVVGTAMGDGGCDDDDGKGFRLDLLAAPLAEIEGGVL